MSKPELNTSDLSLLSGIMLNEISNLCKEIPDEMLQEYVDLYNKLSGQYLTIEYCRKYLMKEVK